MRAILVYGVKADGPDFPTRIGVCRPEIQSERGRRAGIGIGPGCGDRVGWHAPRAGLRPRGTVNGSRFLVKFPEGVKQPDTVFRFSANHHGFSSCARADRVSYNNPKTPLARQNGGSGCPRTMKGPRRPESPTG